jgi:hypothetical protein
MHIESTDQWRKQDVERFYTTANRQKRTAVVGGLFGQLYETGQ